MDQYECERIITELLRRAGLDITVHLESRFPGGRMVGGKYNMTAQTITLYTDIIQAQCLHMFRTTKHQADYFTVVLAHEIGHAADARLLALSDRLEQTTDPVIQRQIALRIEQNAWNYALGLIPEIESTFISRIVDESLLVYQHDPEQQPDIA